MQQGGVVEGAVAIVALMEGLGPEMLLAAGIK